MQAERAEFERFKEEEMRKLKAMQALPPLPPTAHAITLPSVHAHTPLPAHCRHVGKPASIKSRCFDTQ